MKGGSEDKMKKRENQRNENESKGRRRIWRDVSRYKKQGDSREGKSENRSKESIKKSNKK